MSAYDYFYFDEELDEFAEEWFGEDDDDDLEPNYDIEMGFDPYMGSYSDDC